MASNTGALGTAMRIVAGEEPYDFSSSNWLGEKTHVRFIPIDSQI